MHSFVKLALVTTFLGTSATAQVAGGASAFDKMFEGSEYAQPSDAPRAQEGSSSTDAQEPETAQPSEAAETQASDPLRLLETFGAPRAGAEDAPQEGAREAERTTRDSDEEATPRRTFNDAAGVTSNANDAGEPAKGIRILEREADILARSISDTLNQSDDVSQGNVSLDDIDTLNREKAFLEQKNDLDKLRLDALKNQIDMILLMESAAEEIRKSRLADQAPSDRSTSNQRMAPVREMTPAREQTSESEPTQEVEESRTDNRQRMMPMPELPRIAEIVGAGGELVAYGDYNDGRRVSLRSGDVLASGVYVQDVRASGVRFIWPPTRSQKIVTVGPRAQDASQGRASSTFNPAQAVSLGTFAN
jgi:type IV pilus biogenesis protein PilP